MKEATRLYIGTHNGVRVLDVSSNGGEVTRGRSAYAGPCCGTGISIRVRGGARVFGGV